PGWYISGIDLATDIGNIMSVRGKPMENNEVKFFKLWYRFICQSKFKSIILICFDGEANRPNIRVRCVGNHQYFLLTVEHLNIHFVYIVAGSEFAFQRMRRDGVLLN